MNNQYMRAEDAAMDRPTVKKLKQQVERLELARYDAEVARHETIIAEGIRKRIRELGEEPCA